MSVGKITNLFTKVKKGAGVTARDSLNLITNYGIENDLNASYINPRHLLLTSQATLAQLNLEPGELRENIVIKNFPVDELISGEAINIGTIHLRILYKCEPCGFVETIRTGLLKEIHFKRGVLAYVKSGGNIQIGNSVTKSKRTYEEIPYKVFDRFVWTLERIPQGKIVTYTDIVQGLGLFSPYYRVIPAYIAKVKHTNLPIHRIVDSNFNLISQHIPAQRDLLMSEAIIFEDDRVVDSAKFQFDISSLFQN